VRLTEREIDQLDRVTGKGESRSDCIRRCLRNWIAHANLFTTQTPDTEQARIERAKRAAHRANAAPQPELEQHIAEALLGPEEELT